MDNENVEKRYEIERFEPRRSLVGSLAWKNNRRALIISSKAYKESPKEYEDHCIQLEESWTPGNYQELRIVHHIATLTWLQTRFYEAMSTGMKTELDKGTRIDRAAELTERQLRTFQWLDKAIIRNIDLLRRMKGHDPTRRIDQPETRNDREK